MHSFFRWLFLFVALLGIGAAVRAQGSSAAQLGAQGMFPFALPPFDGDSGPTDVSFLNDVPAGKNGFVRAQGESFVDGTGKKIRFWGVNINFVGLFPDKSQAPKIAARLAKFGFNSVRIHHYDGYGAPNGIWKNNGTGSIMVTGRPKVPNEIDPDQLDKLDFFISELIKRGIYIDFNLHVGRKVTEAEGFQNAKQMPDKDKGITYYDSKLIARNRDFAKFLLTHVNPYTNRAYNAEPGVCAIEVANENSILAMWLEGKLGTIPAPYSDELLEQWNSWLQGKYSSEAAFRRSWTAFNRPLAGPELLEGAAPPVQPQPTATPIPAPTPVDGIIILQDGTVPPPSAADLGIAPPPMIAAPTLSSWKLNLAGGATGRTNRDEMGGPNIDGIIQPGLSVQMDKAGTVSWAFQLVRDGLKLESGKIYNFSFSARADKPRTISVNLWEDRPPYRWLGLSQNIQLSAEWQQFSVGFRPVGGKSGQVRLSLNMTNAVGSVQLGSLSLRSGGTITAPREWTLRGGVPFIDANNEPLLAARRDFAHFLGDMEAGQVKEWRQFLRNDLQVQVPIWHSQAQFGGWGGLRRETNSDAIDNHVYWKHPELLGGWAGSWRIENASMATQPLNDPLAAYATVRVLGKPFVVSEWNSGQPIDYGAESLLMAAAYGAYQDWAGIWVFDYHSSNTYDRNKIEGFFSIDSHPLKMATAPLAALMFRRGDVQASGKDVTLAFAPEKEWEEVANTPSGPSLGQFTKTWNASGAPRGASLTSRTTIVDTETPFLSPSLASLEAPDIYKTDSGEIVRDAKRGLLSVNSPFSKSWAGNWGGKRAKLGEMEVWFAGAPTWSAGGLSSMDGLPISQSKRMLLVVAGRAENLNMGWNAERNSVGGQWGNGPTYVSTADATFKLSVGARSARVWALDERGQRRTPVPVTLRDGVVKFKSSPVLRTVWYEIETS